MKNVTTIHTGTLNVIAIFALLVFLFSIEKILSRFI